MSGRLVESVLKGAFWGLLFSAALGRPGWWPTGELALVMVVVVGLAIAAGGLRGPHSGQPSTAAWIDHPRWIYAGTLLSLTWAATLVRQSPIDAYLAVCVIGGMALGVLLELLPWVRPGRLRLAAGLTTGGMVAASLVTWLVHAHLPPPDARASFAVRLVLGIPFFYLLVFAGSGMHSEAEVGLLGAAVGLSVWAVGPEQPASWIVTATLTSAAAIAYAVQILPSVQRWQHAWRAAAHAGRGDYPPALREFQDALRLDPQNRWVRERLWALHGRMDLTRLANDPVTRGLLDLDLCLERAGSLLLRPNPSPPRLNEAHHLLDLVLQQRPESRPAIDYWRAVAFTHAGQLDRTVLALEHLLDPSAFAPGDPYRSGVLLSAWQLALLLHPALREQFGIKQLALPGRRMEAIATVERRLAESPDDPVAWDLKRLLYSDLTEAEYRTAAGDQPARDFDHAYVEQLGHALLENAARWRRGVEFLRLAARGQPSLAPALLLAIARAHFRAGEFATVWDYYELIQRTGRAVGPQQLSDAARLAYFSVVKILADEAQARGNLDRAIENYRLLAASDRSGLETHRALASLYERQGDALSALRATEEALIYNARDSDLLERKDRYYFSVTPEALRERLTALGGAFDVSYCLKKARALLDHPHAGPDVVDWAEHLALLAQVVRPDDAALGVLRARALKRRGDSTSAQALLERVYASRPTNPDSDDAEAWFQACRLLGEMYLYELGDPQRAIACLSDYRRSSRSGADTAYKLGQAYEQLGDRNRAARCYRQVTAFDNHPLAGHAHEALARVQD